jgi:excisionase family DNA binding protein
MDGAQAVLPPVARGVDLLMTATIRTQRPTFYSVAETAQMFGMSEMTLYRAIHDGEFPAIRIRGRLIIPARAIEAMIDAAVEGGLVDAADWVDDDPPFLESPPDPRRHVGGRPRPGANQTGAGSPVTQQGARGEASSMTYGDLTHAVRRSRVGGAR